MTQRLLNIFVNEVFSKPPKRNVYHNDDTWSLELLDPNDYGPKKLEALDKC